MTGADTGMATMRLCAGTLEVEQPDQVLLDHLDTRNSWSYPAYDRLVTNGSTVLVDGDLLAWRTGLHGTSRAQVLAAAQAGRLSGTVDLPLQLHAKTVLLAWPGAACLVWAVQAFRSGPARSAPAEQPDPALSSG